ncbi:MULTISPECIES: ATP-binding cassette domain-containing protein [unclassified Novosphingobium]|uniref:ATP-binding cassette domain-containing protein n=2 Tax=Novosphingobium TaxID=165696 RepID=UPI0010E069FF|nr:ABC transporter ATP-binding protein [Novosphingobium sp. ST904]TCM26159.1 ABC-type multidrug transport system fused ATPase/permease subunit [Novosphingobium sp. ST904]
MAGENPTIAMTRTFRALLAEMMGRALRLRAFVILGLLLETLGLIMTVAYPVALKDLIDLLAGKGGSALALVSAIVLAAGCWAGPNLTGACRHFCTTRICGVLANEFTRRSVASQLPLLATTAKGETGVILGALERMPFSLQLIVDGLMWQVLPLTVQLVVSLIVLAGLAPTVYAWLTTGLLGLVLACAYFNARRWKKLAAGINAASGRMSHIQTDVIRNARRVVFNGNVAGELRWIASGGLERRQAAEAGAVSLIRFSFVQNALLCAGVLFIFYLGALDIRAGVMTVGTFVLIQSYLFRLTQPAASFVFLILGAGVAMENIAAVLDMATPMPADSDREHHRPAGPARISIERLGFSYGAGLPEIGEIDLEIASGSFVAIVGPSGAGKSTLAQLIAGLKSPARGRVMIGDADLSSVEPGERSRHILYVPQFISLFDRPLRDNLLYHPADHDEAAASSLLSEWRFASAGQAIDLDAMVGEMGEKLSGGQVQKVEFARVFGVKVPAIVFDESSSSLDPVSEQQIIDRLRRELLPATTVLFVTHRQTVAQHADSVIFMRGGRVVGLGRHVELLKANSEYRRLWSGIGKRKKQDDNLAILG